MHSCVWIFVLSEETTSEQTDYCRLLATVLTSDRDWSSSDSYHNQAPLPHQAPLPLTHGETYDS